MTDRLRVSTYGVSLPQVQVQVQIQFILFGIVYEKQNVQTLKQARLTSSKT